MFLRNPNIYEAVKNDIVSFIVGKLRAESCIWGSIEYVIDDNGVKLIFPAVAVGYHGNTFYAQYQLTDKISRNVDQSEETCFLSPEEFEKRFLNVALIKLLLMYAQNILFCQRYAGMVLPSFLSLQQALTSPKEESSHYPLLVEISIKLVNMLFMVLQNPSRADPHSEARLGLFAAINEKILKGTESIIEYLAIFEKVDISSPLKEVMFLFCDELMKIPSVSNPGQFEQSKKQYIEALNVSLVEKLKRVEPPLREAVNQVVNNEQKTSDQGSFVGDRGKDKEIARIRELNFFLRLVSKEVKWSEKKAALAGRPAFLVEAVFLGKLKEKADLDEDVRKLSGLISSAGAAKHLVLIEYVLDVVDAWDEPCAISERDNKLSILERFLRALDQQENKDVALVLAAKTILFKYEAKYQVEKCLQELCSSFLGAPVISDLYDEVKKELSLNDNFNTVVDLKSSAYKVLKEIVDMLNVCAGPRNADLQKQAAIEKCASMLLTMPMSKLKHTALLVWAAAGSCIGFIMGEEKQGEVVGEEKRDEIDGELTRYLQCTNMPPYVKLRAQYALARGRDPFSPKNDRDQEWVTLFGICNRYKMPSHILIRLKLCKLGQDDTANIGNLHDVLHNELFQGDGSNVFNPENPACKILEAQTEMLEACKKFRNTDQNAVDFEANRQAAVIAIEECESICLTTPISNKLQRAALAVCAAVAAFFIGFAIGAAAGAWTGPAAIFTGLAAGLYAAIGVVAGSAAVGVGTYAALRHTSLFKMPFEDDVKPVIEQQGAALRM